jgi:hypothetical protein
MIRDFFNFFLPAFHKMFSKEKTGKKKAQIKCPDKEPECYKSRRAALAVMRMQETAGTTLAALLVRFEIENVILFNFL